jgi:tetratricopeptide (TPR) repeat protein
VSITDQGQMWKALGEFARRQSDPALARDAFERWARIQPSNLEPRAALLDLAVSSADTSAIRAEIEALKQAGGPNSPFWRMAEVEEILRVSSGRPDDAKSLQQAESLTREIIDLQPQAPAGYLLEGRLEEKRGHVEKAIAAYEKAASKPGGQIAIGPLITLLVRERRDAELKRVRSRLASIPHEIDRLATVEAVRLGEKDRAEDLAERMVKGDPQALDSRVWQALVLNALGKPKQAEEALRATIQLRPDAPTPWLQLLMLQVNQKETKRAEATVEQIRERVKSDFPELLWAQCYRVIGDKANADKYYDAALKRWPDDVAVRESAISYYEQNGRDADAEASLRHIIDRDPAVSWAARKLAFLLAKRQGDAAAWKEAISLIGPTPKPGETPDDRLARARVYAFGPEAKDAKQAVVILNELAGEIPNSAAVHEQLARLLRDAGQIAKAREHAAKAAEGEAATPDAILLYVSTLLDKSTLDEADKQMARLKGVDANTPVVAELRARILAARGKGSEAAEILETSYASQAKTPDALRVGEKMVGLLLQINQPEAAERVAREVGKLGPRGLCVYGLFLVGRGRNDEAAGQFEQAAKDGDPLSAGTAALTLAHRPNAPPRWLSLADRWLGDAVKSKPESLEALQKLASVRYLQGRFEDQMALFRTILDRNPSDFMFLNDMAWVLSEDLDRPEEGLKRIDEAIGHLGRGPNLLDTRGVILTKLGRLDDAIADLEPAAEALPIGPVYFHLARAYQRKNRNADLLKARELAKKAGLEPGQLQASERGAWNVVMGR